MAEAFVPSLSRPGAQGGKMGKEKEKEGKERKMGKNGGALRKISFSLVGERANGASWWCARGCYRREV